MAEMKLDGYGVINSEPLAVIGSKLILRHVLVRSCSGVERDRPPLLSDSREYPLSLASDLVRCDNSDAIAGTAPSELERPCGWP